MFQRMGRYLQLYYVFSFSVVILGFAGSIYYFLSSGLSNGHNVAVIHETSVWLSELQKNNYLDKIESKVRSGDVQVAYRDFQRLDKRVHDINRIKSVKDYYNPFLKDRIATKEAMDKLFAFQKISKIFQVFTKKLENFQSFVMNNYWRTLTRTSARMLARLNNLKRYSFPEVAYLYSSILKDMKIMENITESSLLPQDDKRLIKGRLKILRTEMIMLEKYIKNVRLFMSHAKRLKVSYQNWSNHIGPEISLEKMALHRKNKKFSLLLMALLALTIVFLLVSTFVYRKSMRGMEKKTEDYVLDLIKNKLLSIESSEIKEGSFEFREKFKKNRQYIHKRMSFGSIFQDSFPFGAILFDSNLKVIWSNQEFSRSWDISKTKIEQGSVNWNDIYRLSNLGEIDPVLDALQNSISGIHQIRIKVSESNSAIPLEMYVNPVEYLGQKRVMVFFYPLSSLEKTIADQVKSITSPIKKSLEALIGRRFGGDSVEQIRDEFFLAGVDFLFDHFQALDESLRVERQGYMEEIERVEDEAEYHKNILDEVKEFIGKMALIQEVYRRHLVHLKGDVVALSENMRTNHVNTEGIITNVEKAVKGQLEVMSLSYEFYEKLQRGQKTLDGLGKLQEWLKKLTYSLQESRYELYQSIDQAILLSRREDNKSVKWEEGLAKMKTNADTFDTVFGQLIKSIKAIDLVLSKMDMILEKDKLKGHWERLNYRKEYFKKGRIEFDALVSNGKKISAKIENDEEKMILDLKRIYEALIQMTKTQQDLGGVLTGDKRSEAIPRGNLNT